VSSDHSGVLRPLNIYSTRVILSAVSSLVARIRCLVPAYGSPFAHDLDNGRRYSTIEDFRNFVKLAYMAPGIHHSGGTVCEPVDLPVNKRHYDMVYSHFKYSDKPLMGSVTHYRRAQDTVDMAKLVFGDEFVDQNCVLTSLINVNSPMVFDGTMLGSLKVYARNNQSCVVSPFILAGAMSPVTVAGTCHTDLGRGDGGYRADSVNSPRLSGCFWDVCGGCVHGHRCADLWYT